MAWKKIQIARVDLENVQPVPSRGWGKIQLTLMERERKSRKFSRRRQKLAPTLCQSRADMGQLGVPSVLRLLCAAEGAADRVARGRRTAKPARLALFLRGAVSSAVHPITVKD